MPKFKTVYTCKSCGYVSHQWVGQCPECDEWNSFVEDVVSTKEGKSTSGGQKVIPNQSNYQQFHPNLQEFQRE